MSIRIPLIAAGALLVTACTQGSGVPASAPGKSASAPPPPAAAPAAPPPQVIEVRHDCCCQCPPRAEAPRPAVRKARHVKPRKHYRRYADTRAAVYVSVEERETYSERYLGPVEEYGYRERYGHGYRDDGYRRGYRDDYRRGYDYGDYDRRRPPPPQARPYDYPLAGRDRDGYLQWPAKVGY